VEPGGFSLETGGRKFHVPFGEYVALSHSVPNRDPATFPDPEAFVPERFSAAATFDDYQLTTFSHGRHACPGRSYAMRLMGLVLEEILSRYDVTSSKPFPAVSFERATLAQRAGPCPLHYRALCRPAAA